MNKKISKKEESKEDPLLSLSLSSNKKNNSLLDTKIFKKLYENFDSQKLDNKATVKNENINDNKDKKQSNKTNKINTSEILSNSEIINAENKNNSLLNTTNNNEEDSIFTNANASNMDDSNATQFNPPPKKLNPRRKNQDKRAENTRKFL